MTVVTLSTVVTVGAVVTVVIVVATVVAVVTKNLFFLSLTTFSFKTIYQTFSTKDLLMKNSN